MYLNHTKGCGRVEFIDDNGLQAFKSDTKLRLSFTMRLDYFIYHDIKFVDNVSSKYNSDINYMDI